jgi:host factor-I protein
MSKMALQDVFLNQVRRENVAVTIFLVNGYQLKGFVKGFDSFTLVLDSEGKEQLVYKHAISTVAPFRPLHINYVTEAFAQTEEPTETV